jgi:hypothetical protein
MPVLPIKLALGDLPKSFARFEILTPPVNFVMA